VANAARSHNVTTALPPVGLGWAQLFLLAVALGLSGLVWRLVSRRREQEALLMAEIREREARLNLALWGSGDEFWDWNIPGNSLYRLGANQLFGQGTLETMSTDEWRNNSIHADDLPRVQRLLQAHIVGDSEQFDSEHRIRSTTGDWVWVRSRGKVVERDAAGSPLRMAGTARDITAIRRAERERRVALEVLRSMSEAVGVIDIDFRFISVNPAFSRITGYSEEEVAGQNSSLLDSAQHSPDFYRRVRDILERTGHWAGEMWQRRKDDEEFLGWIEMSEVRDSLGIRSHFVAVVNDITDKKRAEQELRYLANYDTLTSLPNRALLSERLSRAIVRARRQESRIGVLFLDLDRFKDINDSLGHATGDRILRVAAQRLQDVVGHKHTVARIGGDEFTVLLEDLASGDDAEHHAQRIIDAFDVPLRLDDRHEIAISPSIGISLFPDHAQVPTDLLKHADTAMYQAKAAGRRTYVRYDEKMDEAVRRRATIAGALRKVLDYQPAWPGIKELIEVIEDKLAKGAEVPELKIVTPSATPTREEVTRPSK